MMGYNALHCNNMEQKCQDADSARSILYQKRKAELVTELVDPICVISNANEILESRVGKFVDVQTRSYFEMVRRATMKTKTLIEELRNESQLSRQ